ncbi:carbohydrate ABC transporter membrane protein 1, CUT1 family [Austwickia chelonae]|uniref:Putative ABC transporter permease protein n=1 Tax=Austwickia chelonae NBRC 105200 TaxID=1184607 RepID=K6UL63_9MICO|nr:sugar ABC transporter permease [Austwickia chelonae]GAB76966.1 putative ABC transporter permease protein [Austwickia chelonae NBRC 105200]SEW32814.1 carbohydrate ABC transporter membrane protein 1, CUT1 family [Austwickia chelonae]
MRFHRWYAPWLMVIPALILLLVFSIFPAINTVVLSFTNVKLLGGGQFTGLANYERMLNDDQLLNAILNSVIYMLVCLPLLTILPLLLAMLVQKNLPGIGFFRTVFYFPVVASAVVVALIWQWLLDDRGVINGLLKAADLISSPLPFLQDRWLLIFSAISLTVWKGLGWYMVIYLANLGAIDRTLYEAAAVDGAGSIRRFFTVTLPGVRPTMLLVSVMITVSALRVFTEPHILSGGLGGPGGRASSVVMLIQQNGAGVQGHLGYACALSVLLFFICLGPLLLLARMREK